MAKSGVQRLDEALNRLESEGYRVTVLPTTYGLMIYVSDTSATAGDSLIHLVNRRYVIRTKHNPESAMRQTARRINKFIDGKIKGRYLKRKVERFFNGN